MIKIAALEPNL